MTKEHRYALIFGLCVGALTLVTAHASPVQIKFPYQVSVNTLRGKSVAELGAKLKAATNGRYEVIPYPDGSLYSGSAAANAVQLGIVQMTNESDSAFTGYSNLVNLVEVPFAWPGPKEFQKFTDGPSGNAILQALATKGFAGLALMDEGPMIIATKSKLIKAPQDLKGMKIRTSGHQVVAAALKAMGASTATISFAQTYSALQQGVVDAVYTTFDAYTKAKMYEVAPNVTLFPAHGTYIWVANKAWYDKQPKNVQEDIRKFSRELADEHFNEVWGALKDYVKAVKDHGGHYYEPNKQSVSAFRHTIAPVYAQLRRTYGAHVINTILAGKPLSLGDLTAAEH
ncbi:MAG: TRAP transporter substrate-binding protein [Candidatus Micrarchaeaceae archaeon]